MSDNLARIIVVEVVVDVETSGVSTRYGGRDLDEVGGFKRELLECFLCGLVCGRVYLPTLLKGD